MQEKKNIYENYHKHDHVSNIFTPDTHIKTVDYLKRIQELGYGSYFTTNHGSGGDIFESMTLCKQYDIKCIFGIEAYIVEDAAIKDNSNYHIVIIPVDNIARKKLNLITSKANISGYYYKPRIGLSDLLTLNSNDYYITTACVAGILKDNNAFHNIFIPLMQHFGKNMFIEIQNHNVDIQINHNINCLRVAQLYDMKLIVANDSHYIYPEQSKDRLDFLKGKGIKYGEEDSFVLDFPDYDTLFKRFQKQGILSDNMIKNAIDNTLILNDCEELYVDKSIKMPSIYPDFTADEKIKELKKHICNKFSKIIKEDHITKEELPIYIDGIQKEMKVIEETKEINTADYFLFNEALVDLAINKYNGVLTRTGRGSCGGFYINRILGMTQLDRFRLDIKLYPERFMSTARLLENRALPDIDFNVVTQKPFIDAAKELLGEDGCYPMIAYGTMQIGESFRNVCRSHNIPFVEFNDIAKDIEKYKNNNKWKPLIDEALKYKDTIVSASVHPCAFLLDNKNLEEEYGVVRIGENICVMITSGEADEYKMLKDDFLIVTVYKLIDETFKKIHKNIISIKELYDSLDEDIWNIFSKGLTCTLNQVDGEWATSLLKQYKPHSVSDMAMFVSCLRPFFNSWRNQFIHRVSYTTGSKALDKVLKSTNGYIIFQENLMQYFEWLGVTPAESIGLIKKISKKKIHPEDFQSLENRIHNKWIEINGDDKEFQHTWELVQECMAYGFCSAHGVATGTDALYGAYLKVHYPLEYYTVALDNYSDDTKRTNKLIDELKYFNIKIKPIEFGLSKSGYEYDKKSNTIYKGIESIKYCNAQIADELYELSKNNYNNFIELLNDINEKTSVNSRQLEVLTGLNFFKKFGKNQYLLNVIAVYNNLYGKKQINKKKLESLGLSEYLMKKYSGKETATLYKEINMTGLINELCMDIPNQQMSIIDSMKFEQEYLGKIVYVHDNVNPKYYMVIEFKTFKDVTKPYVTLRQIGTGAEIKTRIKQSKIFKENPFGQWSVLEVSQFSKQKKKRQDINGKWVEIDETEDILSEYGVIK